MTKNKTLVVLIKNLNHGGAQKVCLTICNELVKRNYNIELWVLDYKQNILVNQLDKNIKVTYLNKKRVRDSFLAVTRYMIRERPAKMLVFNVELAILSIAVKKILFLNTYIIFRSINTLSRAYTFPKSKWEKYFAVKTIQHFLPHCNKIIAQSTGMKEDLIRYFRIKESKIQTIFNPAFNLTELEISTNGKMKSVNNFLFVGRLQPQKGLYNLIKIFSKVRDDFPDATLTIVGEGPDKDGLVKFSDELNLSSSVNFMGYQPTPLSFFIDAKATVLTSLYEGFPNVLAESIAAGTPVIAYDCPSGPADIIEPGINGILVPNQDTQAFVDAMKMVAGNKITFQNEAVKQSAVRFSVDSIIDKYEEIIKA